MITYALAAADDEGPGDYEDVPVQLLPDQFDFITCPDKWAGARGGYASGKTTSLFWWLWQRMEEYPRALTAVAGPDYENLRRGFFQDFVGFLESRGLREGKDFRYVASPSPKVIFMQSRAKLHSLSAELRGKVHGIQVQTLACEEATRWVHGEEFFTDLRRRLRHSETSARQYPEMQPQGRIVFNPPPTTHWLYDVCEKQWPKEGYKCWRFSVRDNFLMPGAEEYIRAELEGPTSKALWPSAIDGHWQSVGGSWYRGFDATIHGVAPLGFPRIALDPTREIDLAIDFNIDPMAWNVGQTWTQPSGKKHPLWQESILYVLDSMLERDTTVEEMCHKFDARYGDVARKVGVRLHGDASGRNRTQQSKSSNWDVIKRVFAELKIPINKIRVPKANPEIVDRRNAVMAQFHCGEGFGVLIDLERCAPLVTDFYEIDGEPDKKFKEKHPKLTHASDGYGYWVVRHRMPPSDWSFARARNR